MKKDQYPIEITVDGQKIHAHVEARTLLVDFLRDNAAETSVKIGCEEGACGACTVNLDGKTTKSCLQLAINCDGKEIRTVSSLRNKGKLGLLQQAFIDSHALQCGFCTSGMLMSAEAFLQKKADSDFTENDIKEALTGNLCRCTGYRNIIHAVASAAGKVESLSALENKKYQTNRNVGKAITRREDKRLVSGKGKFADIFGHPADLHAAVARSTRAHANIKSINVTKAQAMPGVTLVIDGEEAKAFWQPISPTLDLLDLKLPRRYPLATEKVVFFGEPVALIIAEDPYIAEDAALAVEVEYEELDTNTDVFESLKQKGRNLLYPEWKDNTQVDYAFERGPVNKCFQSADLVIEEKINSHRYGAMPLETRVVRAEFDDSEGSLVVHSSTQVPHQMRLYLAQVFGLKENRIQVIAGDVGGGFGAKLSVDCEFLPVLGSILTGKPIKWSESRSGWIQAGFAARDYHATSKAAFTKDGKLLALETDIVADMGCDGAERACGLGMPLNGGNYATGPYECDTYRTRVRCVVTNKAPYNAYRGYGKDLANMLVERVIDQAADKLEIDPVKIRKINLLKSYPHQIPTGPIIENGTQRESLERLEEIMDLDLLRQRQAAYLEKGKYLGLSLIPYIEPAGATFPGSAFQNYESVNLRLAADGSLQVLTGIQNIGQGIETSYAQVAADLIGCKIEEVNVSWGDTNATPWGSGTFSSRGSMFAVGAMIEAAKKIRSRIEIGAATLMETAVENISIKNSEITCKKSGQTMTLSNFAYSVYVNPGAEIVLDQADVPSLEALGTYRHPQVNWKPDQEGRAQFYPAHANGAEGMLVEVDPETGHIEVIKIWMVADHGVVLNPLLLQGQIKGGLVQQLGGTLYEKLSYDKNGVPLQKTLKEYGMPTIWTAPEIEIEHFETKSPSTDIGAKGGGEDGCIATSTALMSAVEDALRPLGVKIMSSDLSPKNLKKIIESQVDLRTFSS